MIPKAEKKEIKTEIKQEPGLPVMEIKKEIDDRALVMTGQKRRSNLYWLLVFNMLGNHLSNF